MEEFFAAFLIIILIPLIVILICRSIVLWYFRINEAIDILNKINSNLDSLKTLNTTLEALNSKADTLYRINEALQTTTEMVQSELVSEQPVKATEAFRDSDIPEF